MVLFGQVSFLGLRPAACERRRLTEAQTMLEARHARDLWLRDQIALNLRARSDPISCNFCSRAARPSASSTRAGNRISAFQAVDRPRPDRDALTARSRAR